MTELVSQQCTELTADSETALGHNEAAELLQQLDPRWQLNIDVPAISYTFTFKNYYQTMAFVNVIAQIAHQQDHHPDLLVSYNSCTVTYSTHSVGGLSIKDFICAAKINAAQSL
ncbi:MAG: 4a-hydroxytetrahydrobiopterin dehydratase [Gammaproteobacteria bacterium]|nr:4a-hydroxytetrahydrobiopterin dehydratase [Gammaproteobacteria bacterium]